MSIHFTLFFSRIPAQKSEIEIYTWSNNLQEKYIKTHFPLCAASCISSTFGYQNFQVQAVLNWLSRTASLQLPESKAEPSKERTLLAWLQSWGGQSKDSPWLQGDWTRLRKMCIQINSRGEGKEKKHCSVTLQETLQKHYAANWKLHSKLNTTVLCGDRGACCKESPKSQHTQCRTAGSKTLQRSPRKLLFR